jgi:hypothetical protein
VKAAFNGHDLAAPRQPQRELERVFIGLGAGAHEERRVEAETREACQARGGACAHFERHRVALEDQRVRLLGERRQHARMRITERRDGVATVQVENASPVARVQVHALGVHDVERPLRVDRREVVGGWRPGC